MKKPSKTTLTLLAIGYCVALALGVAQYLAICQDETKPIEETTVQGTVKTLVFSRFAPARTPTTGRFMVEATLNDSPNSTEKVVQAYPTNANGIGIWTSLKPGSPVTLTCKKNSRTEKYYIQSETDPNFLLKRD